MDADILIHEPDTLRNLLHTLEQHPEAAVSVDRPCKDLEFLREKSARANLSFGASQLTRSGAAQLCGQLYCIRSVAARNIYLPKDLAACEDGFIKAMVCTDFGEHAVLPERIQMAPDAAHTFEAYTSPRAILKNQKRQIIGQTMVHILVDHFVKNLSRAERLRLADTLRRKDRQDPLWLKRLVRQHVQRTRLPWQLYPGLAVQRFKGLQRLGPGKWLSSLPAAMAGFLATIAASFMARRFLLRGGTDYWPKAERAGLTRPAFADPGALKSATLTNVRQ